MHDDHDSVDLSIHLEPLDEPAPWPRPRRKLGPYLLIAGAIVLSLSTVLALFVKLVARINSGGANVSVTGQRDSATERAEAVEAFGNFDATYERRIPQPPAAQAERGTIEAFFQQLETCAAAEDNDGFRELVDFDRLLKRMERTGSLDGWSGLQRRYVRTELKSSVELTSFWQNIQVAGIVTPLDDRGSRIVYAHCKNGPAEDADQSQYRFWIAREGDNWKLYDWERLDLGLSQSQEWGLYCKYYETPEMAGYDRWSNLVAERGTLASAGKVDAAKEKMRLAEAEPCPQEMADYRWLLTGFHWLALDESAEAERCYANVQQPDDTPGVYFSLMNIKQWSNPAEALKHAEEFEAAVGPSPSLLTTKANLLERLNRKDEAVAEWKKLLRIEPDDAAALAELFLALPDDDKSAFEPQLEYVEDPTQVVVEVAESVGYRDFRGLSYFVDYLQKKSPDSPAAHYVAGFAKQLDGQYAEAAELFRRAFESEKEPDSRTEYINQYLDAMAANGEVIAAAKSVLEPAEALESLVYRFDESEITLTDDEYRRLLEVFIERCPDNIEALTRQANVAFEQERYDDAERLARRALEQIPPAESDDGESAGGEIEEYDENEYYRTSIVNTLAAILSRQGKLKEACENGSDRRQVFAHLTQLAIQDERWDDARALMTLHRAQDAEDPQLHYVAGELATHEKQWGDAIGHYQEGLKVAEENAHWQWQDRLAKLYIKTDRWVEFYRNHADQDEAFGDLAERFVTDKNWAALAVLIHEHRLDLPADPQLAKFEAEAAWGQEDYASYVRCADEELKCTDESVLPAHERRDVERRRLSALLRDNQSFLALEIASDARRKNNDAAPLAIVYAATGNLPEANRFAREVAAANSTAYLLYSNDDAGRIFLGPEFRDLQRDFPVELPFRGAPAVAVFLFDKPWKTEATDVAAALAALGMQSGAVPQPLNTLGQRITRGFLLRFDEGSIWVVCGDGKFDGGWELNNKRKPLADAVNNSQAWLAVGTAAWTERGRRGLELLARQLASQLAAGEASAFCPLRHGTWDVFAVFPPKADLIQAWQKTGSMSAFEDEAATLETTTLEGTDESDEVTNNRRIERSLRKAVQTFESTPNAKLEVWASLSDNPTIDVLRLDVKLVRRSYGSLEFDGTLANQSVLVPELVAGLPMRFGQFRVCAWRLNDEGPMYRRP